MTPSGRLQCLCKPGKFGVLYKLIVAYSVLPANEYIIFYLSVNHSLDARAIKVDTKYIVRMNSRFY